MGLGPTRYLERGAEQALRERGCEVEVESVERRGAFRNEIGAAMEVNRRLAERVRQAVRHGRFPLVLAGNCNSCLGTLAGLDRPRVGLIWFDAHGDFNTPETTNSGFFEGMPLAAATGRCWRELCAKLPNFRPLPDEHVVLAGVRDLDPKEKELLEQSKLAVVPAARLKQEGVQSALEPALTNLRARIQEIYLHIDIDVLDPAEAPANEYSGAPGGLALRELAQAIQVVGERFRMRAAALTAYNPECDQDDRTLRAGLRLMMAIIEAAAGPPSN